MIILDVESRSRADLRRVGGRRYWEHPSSEILVVVWYDTDRLIAGSWAPGSPWPCDARTPHVAHNAHGFDRFALARFGIAPPWIDSSNLARKMGLPGALDALGQRVCGEPKDRESSLFTRSLSSVRRPSRRHGSAEIPADVWCALSSAEKRERGVMPDITTEVMSRVIRYCAHDTMIVAHAWAELEDWIRVDGDAEALDVAINDRGVQFDRDLAGRLLELDEQRTNAVVRASAAELGWDDARVRAVANSPAQITRELGLADATKATLRSIDHPLVRARAALASIVRGKLIAGLERVHDDGRLRDTLRYYGAHTGRWSGRGMQLQNLPRVHCDDPDALAERVLGGEECDPAALIRSTLCARDRCTLVACDFASIEARATAWAAGDIAALDVFRSARDPYRVAASAIYDVDYDSVTSEQRQIGKIAELALGYGGGVRALESMGRGYGVDVSALDLQSIVDAWRRLHAPIVRLWKRCEAAYAAAVRDGRTSYVGPLRYAPHGDVHVACWLPSDRPIVYRDAGVGTYIGARGEEHVYGGKLVENAVQALCRDLLAESMLACDRDGLSIVMHVHDEIVCEAAHDAARDAYEHMRETMRRAPRWARGLPLDAKGWLGKRYRKD